LVSLTFIIKKAGVDSILSLRNLKDDVSNWIVDNGELTQPVSSSPQDGVKKRNCFIGSLPSH
jgi:hypothetical protein